jgi:hypothetical protein
MSFLPTPVFASIFLRLAKFRHQGETPMKQPSVYLKMRVLGAIENGQSYYFLSSSI